MKKLPYFLACLFLPVVSIISVSAADDVDFRSFDKFRTAASSTWGWTEKEDKYLTFTSKELYYIIGKGAKDFEKQGLKKGVSLLLLNGDKVAEIYLTDFGKFSRAKHMLYKRIKGAANAKPATHFKVSPAYCDEVEGGCVVYWAKGDLYVEMTLSGYDLSKQAVVDAAALINNISSAFSD